jgi:hypothetical protein
MADRGAWFSLAQDGDGKGDDANGQRGADDDEHEPAWIMARRRWIVAAHGTAKAVGGGGAVVVVLLHFVGVVLVVWEKGRLG